jgi:hypothetical protein
MHFLGYGLRLTIKVSVIVGVVYATLYGAILILAGLMKLMGFRKHPWAGKHEFCPICHRLVTNAGAFATQKHKPSKQPPKTAANSGSEFRPIQAIADGIGIFIFWAIVRVG